MRTESTSTVETVQGTHSFKITDYRLHKELSTDKCFCSAIFAVGGHNWCIRYYSEGQDPRSDFVSIFLQLTGEFVEVTASFKFRIMANTGLLPLLHTAHTTSHVVFNGENPMQGFTSFMRKKDLEFLLKDVKDGCLVIECDITVIKEIQVKKSTITSDFDIHVPPLRLIIRP